MKKTSKERLEKAKKQFVRNRENAYHYILHNLDKEGAYIPKLANELLDEGIYDYEKSAVKAILEVIEADFTRLERRDDYIIWANNGGRNQ